MEFDQSYNSSADWAFPSPGATPTTGSFGHNVFHTPKTATFPSHFFQDAFSTPQIPGIATPRQPEYATTTSSQRQHMSTGMLPNGYYESGNPQGSLIDGRPGMAPPGHTGHHAPVLSPAYSHAPTQTSQPGAAMSFDSSQMQTPPPTRGTSAKKPTPQLVAFGTPSTIASRRFMTPQQMVAANPQQQPQTQGPMPFPELQFPPIVYQFGHVGPASAPVYPQTQLFWEQTGAPTGYNQNQQQVLDDPFAPTTSADLPWSAVSAPSGHSQTISFDTPAMSSFPVQTPVSRAASVVAVPSSHPLLSPPVLTSTGVDPSLVYSSPIRPAVMSNTPQSQPRVQKTRPAVSRNDSNRVDHERTSSAESIPLTAQKELQRSNTTGTARPRAVVSSTPAEVSSRRNSLLQPPRTSSPLKRVGKVPMGSISESKPRLRQSVVLTIDETGLARTETRRQDGSPTQSIRERYPGLFDSDSSDEESDEEDLTPSRSASFSFAKREERRSKAARLDPPVENLEGLSIPRSSSSASMKVTPSRAAIAAAAQLRRGGSLRRQNSGRSGQRRTANSTTPSIDTCPMDLSFESHQPGTGVRQGSQEWSGSTLDAHNRRWSMMSLEQQQQQNQQSISPTEYIPELAPSAAALQHQQYRPIRCPCGNTKPGAQRLVQCRSCTQWSHASCIGPQASQSSPPYTCFLCTIPTSGLQASTTVGRRP